MIIARVKNGVTKFSPQSDSKRKRRLFIVIYIQKRWPNKNLFLGRPACINDMSLCLGQRFTSLNVHPAMW